MARIRVELITHDQVISGETGQLHDLRRLEDLLNRIDQASVVLREASVRRLGEAEPQPVGPVVVRTSAVVFGWAEELQRLRLPAAAERQEFAREEKAPRRLALVLPPFHIEGEQYAYPEALDDTLLARLPCDRFFSLSNARVVYGPGGREGWERESIVINGAWVQSAFVVGRREANGRNAVAAGAAG